MNGNRFWAQLALNPSMLNRLQKVGLGLTVLAIAIWAITLMTLQRVHAEIQDLRHQVLNPPEQNTLPPEEEVLLQEIATIAQQVRNAPNPQAYAISVLSQLAQQQGLTVNSVESGEVLDASPIEGGWKPRLLRFQLQGSSIQVIAWLTQLERVRLVTKARGVQITTMGAQKGRLSAVVEMEVLLPDPNANAGSEPT